MVQLQLIPRLAGATEKVIHSHSLSPSPSLLVPLPLPLSPSPPLPLPPFYVGVEARRIKV